MKSVPVTVTRVPPSEGPELGHSHVGRVQKICLLWSDVAPLNTSTVPAAHVKVSAPWLALSKAGVAGELSCGDDIAIPALIVRTELELHAVYK
eukprot:scaffold26940_cov117-Phaeocystis_antarctica.AAC.4